MLLHLALAAVISTLAVFSANAGECLNKAAEATAGTEASAKWFVMETMVQSVSWSLWPSFMQDGSVPEYKVSREKYRCTKDNGSVTCVGQATFCKVK